MLLSAWFCTHLASICMPACSICEKWSRQPKDLESGFRLPAAAASRLCSLSRACTLRQEGTAPIPALLHHCPRPRRWMKELVYNLWAFVTLSSVSRRTYTSVQFFLLVFSNVFHRQNVPFIVTVDFSLSPGLYSSSTLHHSISAHATKHSTIYKNTSLNIPLFYFHIIGFYIKTLYCIE
jgi:hypothetical protein